MLQTEIQDAVAGEIERLRPKYSRESRHTRNRRRPLFVGALSDAIHERAISALWPWSRFEYPGKMRLRAWLLGLTNIRSASVYAGLRVLPPNRSRVLSSRLRSKAAELLEIADACDALADAGVRAPKPSAARKRVAPPSVE